MGRTAKPKDQKELQNRKPNKLPAEDLKTNDPISIIELQEPPDYLNEDALKEWNWITPELCKKKIIAKVDRSVIGAMCQVYGRFVHAQRMLAKNGDVTISEKGYELPSPYIAIANKSLELWHKFLKEYGLTAASRKKLGEEPPPDDNPYEAWQKRKDSRKKGK